MLTIKNGSKVAPVGKLSSARGFSLLEMVISVTLFGMLMGLVFYFMAMGNRGFKFAQGRASVQNQVIGIKSSLAFDLEQTHYLGVHALKVEKTVDKKRGDDKAEARRDVLSLVALSRWILTDGSFDPDKGFSYGGIPQWDAFVVYRPHQTYDPVVKLERIVFYNDDTRNDARALRPPQDFSLFSGLAFEPKTHPGTAKLSTLAENVSHFEVVQDNSRQMINVKLRILEEDAEVADATEENIKETTVVFGIRPKNTVPRL